MKVVDGLIIYGDNQKEDDWLKEPRLVEARFETPNSDFRVIETSVEKAWKLVQKAWATHCKLTGADPDYLEEFKEDIEWRFLKPGQVWMDNELRFWEAEYEQDIL